MIIKTLVYLIGSRVVAFIKTLAWSVDHVVCTVAATAWDLVQSDPNVIRLAKLIVPSHTESWNHQCHRILFNMPSLRA